MKLCHLVAFGPVFNRVSKHYGTKAARYMVGEAKQHCCMTGTSGRCKVSLDWTPHQRMRRGCQAFVHCKNVETFENLRQTCHLDSYSFHECFSAYSWCLTCLQVFNDSALSFVMSVLLLRLFIRLFALFRVLRLVIRVHGCNQLVCCRFVHLKKLDSVKVSRNCCQNTFGCTLIVETHAFAFDASNGKNQCKRLLLLRKVLIISTKIVIITARVT